MKYIIYGKERCVYCQASKKLLDNLGIEYEYKQINKDYTLNDFLELREKYNKNHSTFPFILESVDGEDPVYIGGFSDLDKEYTEVK